MSMSRPVDDVMKRSSRILFGAACALVIMAGFSLFVLAEHTERFFAWTIDPPLTAAFMGSAYFSAAVLQFGAARETSWRRAGSILPGIIVFTVLTLLATLIHIDRFHLDSPIAWIWLAVYIAFPPFGIAVLANQGIRLSRKVSGSGPVAGVTRFLIGFQAFSLALVGVLLFVFPTVSTTVWPWNLTPLTARATGAWLIGMGITAALEYLRNDKALSRLLSAGKAVLVVLVVFSLVNYSADVDWNHGAAWALLAMLGVLTMNSLLVFGERKIALPQSQPPEPDAPA